MPSPISTAQPTTMFSFASKMLNTIMGTEEGQQSGGGVPGSQQHFGMPQTRTLDGGYPQTRPSGQAPGVRPYGAPTFSGPRPNPGLVRGGPPAFGGPPRPMTGPGTPHRFNNNGPQPLQGLPRGMGTQGPPMQFRSPSIAPPSMGVGPPPGMGRPQRPQQQQLRQPFQQQKTQPHLPLGTSSSGGGPAPDLDLSHLSAEERAMIENVMAKAQQLEHEGPPPLVQGGTAILPPQRRPDDQRLGDLGGRLCPLCRQRDISGRDGHPPQECAECRSLVCNRCGGIATHPETKRPEWTCGNCIKRRRVLAAGVNQMGQGHGIGQQRQPPGPYGIQGKPSAGEWEPIRRGSGGSIPSSGQFQGGSHHEGKRTDDNVNFESGLEEDTKIQLRQHSPSVDLDLQSFAPHSPAMILSPTSQSMSTSPTNASASIAKPSCVLLPSHSISLEETDSDESYNGHDTSPPCHTIEPPVVAAAASPPEESQLMAEFNKLQSAVESYSVKRRSPYVPPEPPTPPSPPKLSPQKSFESLSPLPSPISLIQSPGDSPLSPDSKFPPQRKAIVVQEYELDNEYKSSSEEERSDSDSDDEAEHVVQPTLESSGFYDHSPGEVYTIPEEEDEGGSPTGGDLVSSLSRPGFQSEMGSPRRRLIGQECLPGQMILPEHRQGPRAQLRPQRSLDNRLVTSSSASMANHQDKMVSLQDLTGTTYSSGAGMMPPGQIQMTHETSFPQQHYHEQYDLQQGYGPSQYGQVAGINQMQQQSPQQSTHQQAQSAQSQQQSMPSQISTEMNQFSSNVNLGGQGQPPLQPLTHDPSLGLPSSQFQSYQPQVTPGILPSLQPLQPQSLQPQQQALSSTVSQPQQQQQQQSQYSSVQQTPLAIQPTQQSINQPEQQQQYQTFPPQHSPLQLQSQQQQQFQQQQAFLQQQLQYQQQPQSQQSSQQFPPAVPDMSGYSAQEPWSTQELGGVQYQNFSASQYSQSNQQQPQYSQSSQQLQPLGSMGMAGGQAVTQQQGGPGTNKSISGLLADFSRALGLGTTSPRPSPMEEKSELFPPGMPPPSDQSLSPYEQYFQPPGSTNLTQGYQSSFYSSPQTLPQSSAFSPIQDLSQIYAPPQNRPQQQQYPYQNQPTSIQQQAFGTTVSPASPRPSLMQQPPYAFQPQVLTSAGMLTQQQAQSLGVGALTPAQAQMYQQQMALQHQAQHLKKTSRRAHLGEMRRDGTATVLIPGQGPPGGMTIGALTPAVVTSLGTFVGGGATILTSSLLPQPLAVTPLGTPVGTPRSGRDAGDSSDTMSETDSQKSLRMRRKLPCLPPDQEAAPLPSTKLRDRERAMEFRSLSPIRSSYELNSVRSYPLPAIGLSRPSASESNLRKMVSMAPDHTPRPGSALGLLQGASVVSSISGKMDSVYPLCGNLFSTSSVFPTSRLRVTTSGLPLTTGGDFTTTTSGLYSTYKPDNWSSNIAELAACLPPDLRHLLNKDEFGDFSSLTSNLGDTSSAQLPTFMKAVREQLQEERRQLLTEERRRLDLLRERDRELGARVDAVTGGRSGSDSFQSRAESCRTVGLSRSAGASPLMSRKIKCHQRQLSDPKISLPFSPIEEDGELQDFDRGPGILKYKSYNTYGSLDDVLGGDWDHSQSYLASSWAAAGGVLRETAINSMSSGREDCDDLRLQQSDRYLPRRNSDGESWPLGTIRPISNRHRRHHLRKHRKSRSWNPSPYVSEEEEEEDLSREEKKARIKAEIARRRQQLQERAGLHQELVRISRLREGPETEKHSVLKSVDQLLRDQYNYDVSVPTYGSQRFRSSAGVVISPCASEEDKSIELIASTFRSDDYTSLLYEKLGEMSPMGENEIGPDLTTMAAMPLLEDMPTRSRRILEDLHRSEIVGYSSTGGGGGGTLKERPPGRSSPTPILTPTTPPTEFLRRGLDLSSQSQTPDLDENETKSITLIPSSVPDSPVASKRGDTPARRPSSAVSSFCKYPFDTKRILLTKDPKDISSNANSLGLKIVGGKELPFSGGRVATYVAKVYDGPESLGDVKEGDVVLEWNGLSLDNKTFEEVQRIIQNPEGEVELVLRCNYNIITGKARATGHDFAGYESSRDSDGNITIRPDSLRTLNNKGFVSKIDDALATTQKPTEEGSEEALQRKYSRDPQLSDAHDSPSTSTEATNTSTGTISINRQSSLKDGYPEPLVQVPSGLSWRQRIRSSSMPRPDSRTKPKFQASSQIKLQICHDSIASVLYVTVIKAKLSSQILDTVAALELDPYVIVDLLPEQDEGNQRRTRHIRSSTPVWNQTMVYPNVTVEDLKQKFLNVAVWNHTEGGEDEILGKIVLHLSAEGILDEQPHPYYLEPNDKKGSKKGRKRFDSYSSNRRSIQLQRSSESGVSSRGSFLAAGSDLRNTMGRLSLFSPSGIPANTGIPSDCRGSLCQIL